ncbi:hypothetical protein [Albimonas pacifica]|uniref:VPLPA-CTERM protein sorting domain-containing protein n=1 Tax=Albimonas pacifica TaxID=1114924 RepID=A0A1I3KM47_9RHOB|nr:hypothetical protein [Albimonas pacifica]SFI73225.1 VPLPA-CTERM protein sorting domain-containing protein [Albimonas pacifica]
MTLRSIRRLAVAAALGLAVGLPAAGPASALQILLTERTSGQTFSTFSRGTAGPEAPGATGGGTLGAVMAAAAAFWEDVILDPGTLSLEFGWQALSGSTLAVATQLGSRDYSGAGKGGLIRVDNDRGWFLDPTPTDASEFGPLIESIVDLGGGPMTVGREYAAASGPAAGVFDLFGTVLHEIGHLLGLADFGDTAFDAGELDIAVGPYAGAVVDLTEVGGGHLDMADALMKPTTPAGLRRMPTDADVAAIQQLSGFVSVDYSLSAAAATAPVPLPAGWALMIGAAGALGLARRRAA